MRHNLLKKLILILGCLFAVTQIAWSDEMDNFVGQEMTKRKIPGLAFAVLKQGEVVLQRTYGLANLETGSPVSVQSAFEIASLTKPFTAFSVMVLLQEGKIQLNDSIQKYVDGIPENWKGITVRHLLTHTSGFKEQVVAEYEESPLMDVTTRLQLQLIQKEALLFQPGEKAQYSDPGYFLLGMIIEKASGLTYGEFLRKKIFEPAGMRSSRILNQWEVIPNRVAGYTLREGELKNARRSWQHELPSFFGIVTTIIDMARWETAIAKETILSRSSLEQMFTPAKLSNDSPVLVWNIPYGFGWMLSQYRGLKVVEHGGFSGTHMLRFPDAEVAVIVLTNLDLRSGSQPHVLARGIADRTVPEIFSSFP